MFDRGPFQLPQIYPITDVSISDLSHAEQVDRLIRGGAMIIQLREKNASPREFCESAKPALELTSASGIPLIINDRADIALALKADGVHLGHDDLPPLHARVLLGRNAIIGLSTHSVEQAIRAAEQPVTYIAIGPIFQTRTKDDADKAVGLDGLRAVRDAVGDIPLVAIGGINAENIRSVFDSGADSAAIIGALLALPDEIEPRMKEFIRLVG
jgi:thiamine-phosphate pyrophosphorylase